MPKASRNERYMHDLQHVYMSLHEVLAPRGLYPEASLMLVTNLRYSGNLRDVAIELVIRSRVGGTPVWRAHESLRVPGRMKLRSVADALCGLMLRATYDIEAQISLPGSAQDRQPGRARP
jgi:hypothetical protein